MSSQSPDIIQKLVFDTVEAERNLDRFFSKVEGYINRFGGAINNIVNPQGLGQVGNSANQAGQAFNNATTQAQSAASAINTVGSSAQRIQPFLDALANAQGLDKLRLGLERLGQTFGTSIPQAATVTKEALGAVDNIAKGTAQGLEAARNSIQKFTTDAKIAANEQLKNTETIAQLKDQRNGISDPQSPQFQQLSTQINQLTQDNQRLGEVQRLNTQAASALNQQATVLNNSLKIQQSEVRKTTKEFEDLVKAQSKAVTEFGKLQREGSKTLAAGVATATNFRQALTKGQTATDLLGNDASVIPSTYAAFNQVAKNTQISFGAIADSAKKATTGIIGNRDIMLSLLGVSRLLPPQLSSIVSGFSLLSVGAESSAGAMLGVIGIFAAAGLAALKLGADFNKSLNSTRAQAEGLGLTVGQIISLQKVLDQTGGSVENLSVGIKKLQEARVGIGSEATKTRGLIETIFPKTNLDDFKDTNDIIVFLAKNMKDLEKSGLGNVLASQLFARSFDEVKGRLQDVAEELERVEKKRKELGLGSPEQIENAKRYARALTDIDLAFESIKSKFAKPLTLLIEITSKIVGDGSDLLALLTPKLVQGVPFGVSTADIGDSLKDTVKNFSNRTILPIFRQLDKITGGKVADAIVNSQIPFEATPEGKDKTQVDALDKKLAEIKSRAEQQLEALKEVQGSAKEVKAQEIAILEEERNQLNAQLSVARQIQDTALSAQEARAEAFKKSIQGSAEFGVREEELKLAKSTVQKRQKQVLDLIKEVDTLSDRISELNKKERTKTGRTQEQRNESNKFDIQLEDLRAARSKLLPDSEAFNTNIEKERSLLTNRIAELAKREKAGSDAGALEEREKRLKELNRGKEQTDTQVAKRRIDLAGELLEDEKRLNAQKIQLLEVRQQGNALDDQIALSRGEITTTTFLNNEAARSIETLQSRKSVIAKEIKDIGTLLQIAENEKNEGRLGESEFEGIRRQRESQVKDLQAQSNLVDQQFKTIGKPELEEAARLRAIDKRQKVFDIELEQQENQNQRRLQLIEVGSKATLDREKEFVEEEARLLQENIRKRQANLLTELNDLRFSTANLDENSKSFIIKVKPRIVDADRPEIENTIKFLQEKSFEGSDEFLSILQRILAARNEEADIFQNRTIKLQEIDNRITERKIAILQNSLDIEHQLLDVQSRRIDILNGSKLLTDTSANERQLAIDKQRLEIIRQQVAAKTQEASTFAANRIAETAISGGKIDTKFLDDLFNRPELQTLNRDFLNLTSTFGELRLQVEINDSLLGRVAKGFSELARAAEGLSDRVVGLPLFLRGIEGLILGLLKIRVDKPEDKLKAAAEIFKKTAGTEAGDLWKKAVLESVGFLNGKTPDAGGTSPNTPSTPESPTEKEKRLAREARQRIVTGIFASASSVLQGLSADTAGGKISAFGGAASSLLESFKKTASAAPIVGGIVTAFSGVLDFVNSRLRRAAEAQAAKFTSNFKSINDAVADGSKTIGQGIQEISTELNRARSTLTQGKGGKKYGKSLLANVEADAAEKLKQLRKKAESIQNEFTKSLEELSISKDLRDATNSINELKDRVKEYVDSFEDSTQALAGVAKAQKFFELSIGELLAEAQQEGKEAILKAQESERDYQKSRLAILNEGRVTSPFDASVDKLKNLFELESKRLRQKIEEEAAIAKTQQKIDLFQSALNSTDSIIDKLAVNIDKLGSILAPLANNGFSNSLSDSLQDTNRSSSALRSAFTNNQSQSIVNNITVNSRGGDAVEIGREVRKALDGTRFNGFINPVANLINPDRPFR